MGKVKVEKVECRFPTLFKLMWLSTVLWIIVEVANYYGHWLMQDKLDGFGMSILLMFGITIIVCFWKGFMELATQHGVFTVDAVAKRLASYTMLITFVVMLLSSIWKICGPTDSHAESLRNGATEGIPEETLCAVIADLFNAALLSIAVVIGYWYVRVCFILFFGRIRRIGIEVALAIVMLWYLSANMNDSIMVDTIVVLIAGAFLYDLWRFADFKETQFSMSQIKNIVSEEDNNE